MGSLLLELDEEEVASLNQLLDIALKQAGYGALKVASHWFNKLEKAKTQEGAKEEEDASSS